jgi:hypothetical protein
MADISQFFKFFINVHSRFVFGSLETENVILHTLDGIPPSTSNFFEIVDSSCQVPQTAYYIGFCGIEAVNSALGLIKSILKIGELAIELASP